MTDRTSKTAAPELPYVRPDRIGKKTLVAFVTEEMSDNIRHAAITTKGTVQLIASQAIEEWWARYDRNDPETLANIRARVQRRVLPGPKSTAQQEQEVSRR